GFLARRCWLLRQRPPSSLRRGLAASALAESLMPLSTSAVSLRIWIASTVRDSCESEQPFKNNKAQKQRTITLRIGGIRGIRARLLSKARRTCADHFQRPGAKPARQP